MYLRTILDEAKNQISDLEYKEAKNNQSEQKEEEKIQKDEDSIRSLWDNFKYNNICIIVVPEEEREQEIENSFEKIITETFPNLVKEIDIQVQEA